jgi:DNA-binding NarL/FixJ family response regulator
MSRLHRTAPTGARVRLAEDHPAGAEDLRVVLASEVDVIATVGDGDGLVAAADTLTPDVLVTDIARPGRGGMAAAGEIRPRHPRARRVLVTVPNAAELVQNAVATGVLGDVLKLTAGEELVPATHAARRGERDVARLVRHRSTSPQAARVMSQAGPLTGRETRLLTRQVARIAAVGRGLGRGIALACVREDAAARDPASMSPEAQGPQPAAPLTDGIAEATASTGATLHLVTALKAAHPCPATSRRTGCWRR